jgi:hypothetical protein
MSLRVSLVSRSLLTLKLECIERENVTSVDVQLRDHKGKKLAVAMDSRGRPLQR